MIQKNAHIRHVCCAFFESFSLDLHSNLTFLGDLNVYKTLNEPRHVERS